MTISSTSSRVVYTGNGLTTSFPFAFYINDQADLVVTYTDALGSQTTVSPSNYTISQPAASAPFWPAGGTVTYLLNGSPIAASTTLTLQRVVPSTQPTTISNQGAFWPQVVERALDRVITIVQGYIDAANRSLQISVTDGTALNTLPPAALRKNSVLGFDANGQPYAATLASNIVSVNPWVVSNFFPSASGSAACAAIGAPYLSGNNTFTGSNTFQGTTTDFSGTAVAVADLADLDYSTKPVNSRFFWDYLPPSVRQTVFGGPVDSNGLPNFLPASASGLTLTAQNITSTYPLIATAANGVSNRNRNRDLVAAIGAASWNLTNNTTNYLYVTISGPGGFTVGTTTLAPIYQWGGVPSTTNGQFTFNIAEMRGYMGNGTTAPQAYIVFVGEAVTSGGNITSTVAYAYNGHAESAFTNTLPGVSTNTSFSHNLGIQPRFRDLVFECISTEASFAVGEQITMASGGICTGTSSNVAASIHTTAKTMVASNASGGWATTPPNNTPQALTANKWKFKFVASRGW